MKKCILITTCGIWMQATVGLRKIAVQCTYIQLHCYIYALLWWGLNRLTPISSKSMSKYTWPNYVDDREVATWTPVSYPTIHYELKEISVSSWLLISPSSPTLFVYSFRLWISQDLQLTIHKVDFAMYCCFIPESRKCLSSCYTAITFSSDSCARSGHIY